MELGITGNQKKHKGLRRALEITGPFMCEEESTWESCIVLKYKQGTAQMDFRPRWGGKSGLPGRGKIWPKVDHGQTFSTTTR